jgi:retinol-binding protein 3
MKNTARRKKPGRYDSQLSGQRVRASRVPRFGPRVLGIALGVASTVCAVACKDGDSTSTSKEAQLAASPQAPSTGDVSAGETPAQKQFAAWQTAFNSGDRGALVAYHQKYFPYEVASHDVQGIDREFGLSRGTGGFHLKKTENPAPTSIVAILKERHSEQFARVAMEVDAAEPHRVLHFEIHPIPTPDEFFSADERKSRLIDDAKRRSLIDGIAKELQAHYVIPDVANRMITALRDHLAHGDYDKITSGEELAATVTKDLRDVSHDLHLGLMFGRRRKGPEPSLDDQRAMVRAMNYGFGPIERMSGNVAHVVIDGFPPILDDDSRKAVADLMSQVADADALLVDLRDNRGGSPDTVALIASYLFDTTPVHLNDMFSRDTGSVQQSWTVRDLRGTRFGGQKPVYVLTSKRTFSGGEEFAYDLQSLHRATIVGETTAGGAHPVGPHELNEWFTIVVPSGRAINPVTKTDWEGTGVVPDIAVTADQALDEAHRRALDDVSSRSKRPARP